VSQATSELEPGRVVPEPGQAVLPAVTVGALLRRNATDPAIRDRPFLRFGELEWTHREYVEECRRWAALLRSLRPAEGPFNVGVLLDNTPAYLAALGGSALAGAALVGLNHTRRDEHLARDIRHTDVSVLITEPRHAGLLEPMIGDIGVPPEHVFTTARFGDPGDGDGGWVGRDLDEVLAGLTGDDPGPGEDPPLDTTWCLVFTSGTSGAPKAVICSQRRMLGTGSRMAILLDITAEDVGYIAMPLFHSNALMVGYMPALVTGAAVGLARRFTASGWLDDVRRYGATWFNYTGKPLSYILSTPERPDDAENTLRRAYGNEGSPQVVERFSARYGVRLIDAFGPTEGGIAITPGPDTPPGALGRAGDKVKVVDADGAPRPLAVFGDDGTLRNSDECVGEIVNTAGAGPFEGYYNNPEATQKATRFGWYWTGDLGYIDADGFIYFAGRTSDWIRVDGENFPAAPIERTVSRHPSVVLAAAYGVPDTHSGDQVMIAMTLKDGAELDPSAFSVWLDDQADLGPKWRPRYLRIAQQLPTTGTNKVVVRTLQREKFRLDRVGDDAIYVRERGETAYRPFTPDDEGALRAAFRSAGRERFWDL
jgi:fatty-acyl-CoA synthase